MGRTSILSRNKRRKTLLKFLKNFLIVFFGGALIISLIAIITHLERFKISEISVAGNTSVPSEYVLDIVKETIDGSYALILSRDNFLIYPRKNIKNNILNNIPRIRNVFFSLDGFNTLNVLIEERKPFALWCGMEIDERRECYFLDDESFIFAKAPRFSEDVYLKYLGGQVNESNPISSHYYNDKEFFEELNRFLEAIEDMDFSVSKLFYDGGIEFEAIFSGGEKLIFSSEYPLIDTYDRLFILLRENEDDLFHEGGEPAFEYIDMRFGSRIFYLPSNDVQ